MSFHCPQPQLASHPARQGLGGLGHLLAARLGATVKASKAPQGAITAL